MENSTVKLVLLYGQDFISNDLRMFRDGVEVPFDRDLFIQTANADENDLSDIYFVFKNYRDIIKKELEMAGYTLNDIVDFYYYFVPTEAYKDCILAKFNVDVKTNEKEEEYLK